MNQGSWYIDFHHKFRKMAIPSESLASAVKSGRGKITITSYCAALGIDIKTYYRVVNKKRISADTDRRLKDTFGL